MKIENNHIGNDNSRVNTLSFNSKKLMTPFYFPSITSTEIRSDITDTIDFIIKINYPAILISCYDLFQLEQDTRLMHKISRYHLDKGIVFLDSGEFERYHFKRVWLFEDYQKTINKTKADFFTSFDKTATLTDSSSDIDSWASTYIPKSQKCSKGNFFIAICHGKNVEDIYNSIKKLLKNNDGIQIIAIPERECGTTIIEQYNTIKKIRQIVNEYKKNIIIHILGCGNPISIAIFVYAGADTFDAVDWCRWSINPSTLQYGNLTHLKLFNCECDACDTMNIDERIRSWSHNLIFYNLYLLRLRKAIKKKKTLTKFLNENIDQNRISNLSKHF